MLPHLLLSLSAHNKFDDIQDRAVLDLGCCTCMLSTAAKILGAGYVCGMDVDGDALEIAQRNVSRHPMQCNAQLIASGPRVFALMLMRMHRQMCADLS